MVSPNSKAGRARKTFVILLLLLSTVENLGRLYPISSEALWPVRTVANEITPWFILVNLLGALLAIRWSRPIALLFVLGFGFSAWPLIRIPGIESDMARQWRSQRFPETALQVPSPGEVFWQSFSGLAAPEFSPQALPLKMLLYKSPQSRGGERLPIVINIHGGSWQVGGPGEDSLFSSHLASKGYAVFSIDYRRAPAARFPAQLDDVRASIEWIYSNAPAYGADPSRMTIAGRSAGGHLAMLAGYTSDRVPIRAVVSFYGPPDLRGLYADPPSPDPLQVRSKLVAFLDGSPEENPEAYRAASPMNYVRGKLPPTLQIQGLRDHVIKARFPREFHQRLLANGTRSLLLELPWSDHSFDFVYFGPGNVLALAYVETFLSESLH